MHGRGKRSIACYPQTVWHLRKSHPANSHNWHAPARHTSRTRADIPQRRWGAKRRTGLDHSCQRQVAAISPPARMAVGKYTSNRQILSPAHQRVIWTPASKGPYKVVRLDIWLLLEIWRMAERTLPSFRASQPSVLHVGLGGQFVRIDPVWRVFLGHRACSCLSLQRTSPRFEGGIREGIEFVRDRSYAHKGR